jgi:succinyl-CoA synthetase beta subunit
VRNVSERFVQLMTVRLAGGNAEEAKNMLGTPGHRGSYDSDMDRLANFVTKEARWRVNK